MQTNPLRALPLTVSGSGFVVQAFRADATAFGNRDYVWKSVPPTFADWHFTQTNGGQRAQIMVRGDRDGFVYLAADSTTPGLSTSLAGWGPQPDLSFRLTDRNRTIYAVYRLACSAGKTLSIPQVGWSGGIVLAPALSLDPIASFTTPPLPTSEPPPPGVVIDSLPVESLNFVGSPAIVILPDGTYIASHDIFFRGRDGNHTRIFHSSDRGRIWQPLAEIVGQYWSNLFLHRGALYLFGTSNGFGHIVLRRSLDGGRTWTEPRDARNGILSPEKGISCAPTPVVEANGRLWKAFEVQPPSVNGRQFQPFAVSAPSDADLLDASRWTFTNRIPYNAAEVGGNWLEGNVVVAPDGGIVNILRISRDGGEKAALLHVSPEGRTIDWNPSQDVLDFPGGGVKFTIRYDRATRRYWALVNKQRRPDALRNVLALTSSPDLRRWTVEATLLSHPDRAKHAFQYVDWQFDGADIVAVSRTSWSGDTYHNANLLTFHRLRNFRDVSRTVE